MNIKIAAAGSVAALLFLAGCATDADETATETTETSTMTEEAMEDEGDEAMDEPGTIVDVAAANPDFETLVAAVTAADLGETLSGEGPFTVAHSSSW